MPEITYGRWSPTEVMERVLDGTWVAATEPFFMAYLDSAYNDQLNAVYVDNAGQLYGVGTEIVTGANDWSAMSIKDLALEFAQNLTFGSLMVAAGITGDNTDVYVSGYEATGSANEGLVVKYNSAGAVQWQRGYGIVSTNCRFNKITRMANGNLAVAGVDVSNGRRLLVTLQTNGTAVAAMRDSTTSGYGVVSDSSSNLYVVGDVVNKADICKYTSGLSVVAGYQIDATVSRFEDIATDGTDFYPVGTWNGSGSGYDAIIYSFDDALNVNWSRRLYSANTENFYSCAVDSQGNIYAVGRHYTPTVVGLLAKYDSTGALQWQRTIAASAGTLLLRGVYIDSNDNVNVVGVTATTGSNNCQFVACLPNDGSQTGAYVVGTETFTYAASTLTDAAISPASTTNTQPTSAAPNQGTPTFTETAATTTLELETL